MIVVHCFTRTMKKRSYLLADSTASKGQQPLWTSTEVMFELNGDETREAMAERVRLKVLAAHPRLVYFRTMYPRTDSAAVQVCDVAFKDIEEIGRPKGE